jgi:hypothetical protein
LELNFVAATFEKEGSFTRITFDGAREKQYLDEDKRRGYTKYELQIGMGQEREAGFQDGTVGWNVTFFFFFV